MDDNPRNVEVAATLLGRMHYEIEYANNGAEALQWVEQDTFDLILMDIMMPVMDGFETCRRIKEIEAFKDVPVIFLTAKTDAESLSKAFVSGGLDYISKPFRPEELLARVATHVELKRRKEELKDLNGHLEEKVAARTRELEKSNAQLAIAMRDIKILDRAKTEFLQMASHEIRTPLNGILGGVELMKMSELTEDFKESLDILDKSTRRLERFSLQALEIAQLQTKGDSILHLRKFSFSAFLEAFIKEFSEKKGLSGERLHLNPVTGEVLLVADPNYLEKLLNIVVDNALTYSPNDKPVIIQLSEGKENLVCTITDGGQGFPAAMLEKSLMNYQIGVDHEDQRTGLNLNLAHLIMNQFKGELRLANAPHGGAVATLIFPTMN